MRSLVLRQSFGALVPTNDLELEMPYAGGLRLRCLGRVDAVVFERRLETFETYLADQEAGRRWVRVAESAGEVAGYVTLLWAADDPIFAQAGVPEIVDLAVLAPFRRRGIGSALLDRVEGQAATRSPTVGLNVGLHSGYGPAQRLYARRGYLPDGSGVVVEGVTVPEGATIRLDDDPIGTLRMTKSL